MATNHLDLGCGETPRTPYRQSELYGVDISPLMSAQVSRFKTVLGLLIKPENSKISEVRT